MLLRLKIPKQKHGTREDLNYLEIDSETTVVASVVGVEKSEHSTRYHLASQKLVCTNYPGDFESIILKKTNSTKVWTLEVEIKCFDPDNPSDPDPLYETHSLEVSSVKEVSNFWDID